MQEVLSVWNFMKHQYHTDGILLRCKGRIWSRTLGGAEQAKGNMAVLYAKRRGGAVTGFCRLSLRTGFA